MHIKPEELTENGYILLDMVGHQELIPFIKTYINKRTKYSVLYYLCNLIMFGCVGFAFVYDYNLPSYKLGERFTHFSYGLALAFALVPLHEYIHVLAYRSQGATTTSYDTNLKKFYFMALADKFVANKREFEVVALAPFVSITTTLLILLVIVPNTWIMTILSLLLAHTAMCSGDFGLLSYFEYNTHREPVTYDDVEHHISYFYGKSNEAVLRT